VGMSGVRGRQLGLLQWRQPARPETGEMASHLLRGKYRRSSISLGGHAVRVLTSLKGGRGAATLQPSRSTGRTITARTGGVGILINLRQLG
jgi:hypothetical protein